MYKPSAEVMDSECKLLNQTSQVRMLLRMVTNIILIVNTQSNLKTLAPSLIANHKDFICDTVRYCSEDGHNNEYICISSSLFKAK